MDRQQLVAYYRQILRENSNRKVAVEIILKDINSLVWLEAKIPLTEREKSQILDEIFQEEVIIRKSVPSAESSDFINEADNSGILDVISALKRGVKDK